MFSGIMFITGPWISIIMVYDRYFEINRNTPDKNLDAKNNSTITHVPIIS